MVERIYIAACSITAAAYELSITETTAGGLAELVLAEHAQDHDEDEIDARGPRDQLEWLDPEVEQGRRSPMAP